jgi:hypothetical protein
MTVSERKNAGIYRRAQKKVVKIAPKKQNPQKKRAGLSARAI